MKNVQLCHLPDEKMALLKPKERDALNILSFKEKGEVIKTLFERAALSIFLKKV